MTPVQLRALTIAAKEHGNGIVEITARGNLQFRGLRRDTVGPFSQAVFAAGVVPSTGLAIETPPLAGLDAREIVDARPLAHRLRDLAADVFPPGCLAPKLSVVIDGGGGFHLDDIAADIRLTAVSGGAGQPVLWHLAVAGDAATARPFALLEEENTADAVLAVLHMLADCGPSARARDLSAERLAAHFATFERGQGHGGRETLLPPGVHSVAGAGSVLGVGFAYCQSKAEELSRFLEEMEAMGATGIRLSPQHSFFVLGLPDDMIGKAVVAAERHGFRTAPDDPRNHISLCAGARGCASGHFDTHHLASVFERYAPDLLDGSLTLHISGCPKGCAHPQAAALTVAGSPSGHAFVVNGPASRAPDLYIHAENVDAAVKALGLLIRQGKEAGESARSCLTRLGAPKIAGALRRE